MNSLKITTGARLRILAAAATLTCAVLAVPAGACPSADQPTEDAFAVAEGADLSYLPFTLGEAQDEHASLTDRAIPGATAIAADDEPIVVAGSFEFD